MRCRIVYQISTCQRRDQDLSPTKSRTDSGQSNEGRTIRESLKTEYEAKKGRRHKDLKDKRHSGVRKHVDRKRQVASAQAVGISFILSSIDRGKVKGDGTEKPGVCQVH